MNEIVRLVRVLVLLFFLTVALLSVTLTLKYNPAFFEKKFSEKQDAPAQNLWRAPDLTSLEKNKEGELIQYGRELIARTAHYLGPQGSVMQVSNGMNCQNCHLEA